MEATGERITARRYLETSVEGDRTQLVEGEIVVSEPKPTHAHLQIQIAFALESWIRAGERRGMVFLPTSVRMDDFNVYGPDVLWFREERVPADLRLSRRSTRSLRRDSLARHVAL